MSPMDMFGGQKNFQILAGGRSDDGQQNPKRPKFVEGPRTGSRGGSSNDNSCNSGNADGLRSCCRGGDDPRASLDGTYRVDIGCLVARAFKDLVTGSGHPTDRFRGQYRLLYLPLR